jgi:uncharacterized protein YaeQ
MNHAMVVTTIGSRTRLPPRRPAEGATESYQSTTPDAARSRFHIHLRHGTSPTGTAGGLAVALTATIHTFGVELADIDRGIYTTLDLRVARHPSETEEFLLTRVLAYCLEYTDGLAFSRGLAEPDEPALTVRDLTGSIKSWIEVGAPDGARLHRASKAAARVAVYVNRIPGLYLRQLQATRIHRAAAIELFSVDPDFLSALARHLERRTIWSLSITDRHLYLTVDGETLETVVEQHRLQATEA